MARLLLWSLFISFVILISQLSSIKAIEDVLIDELVTCSGMFGKSAIPGGSDPKITAKYLKENSFSNASLIIYEWADSGSIGDFCNDELIEKKGCNESQRNQFIVDEKAKSVWTGILNSSNPEYVYNVSGTGYFCAGAIAVPTNISDEFYVLIDWRNPYGELSAADYPKLPFYGVLSLVYLVIGVAWMSLSFIHWRDILQVQNYISGVILFLMLEMAFNWGYWENYNTYGYPSKFLLGLVAVLNAGRNSISFFMLLIVCMGYGVVKPTLGSTMNKCRALGGAHFIFGIIYAAGTMLINPDTTNPLIFLVIFPLAFTMTAFYIWTLQSITNTLQTLEIRRQNVKALMYKRLYRLLVFSMTVLGIFFLINTFNYAHRDDLDWIAKYWQWRWFLLDGWLNILYLIVFCVILIIWRPTRNNKRFAMSEELTQDDDDMVEKENNILRSESLGYDQVKYRGMSDNTGETERLREGNESAIFDIGDHEDGDEFTKWDDEESTARASGGGSSSSQEPPVQQRYVADGDEENNPHIEQEISKLN